jgi:hypothetical protein
MVAWVVCPDSNGRAGNEVPLSRCPIQKGGLATAPVASNDRTARRCRTCAAWAAGVALAPLVVKAGTLRIA